METIQLIVIIALIITFFIVMAIGPMGIILFVGGIIYENSRLKGDMNSTDKEYQKYYKEYINHKRGHMPLRTIPMKKNKWNRW